MYDAIILKEIKIENKLVSSIFFVATVLCIQNSIYLFLMNIVLSILFILNQKNDSILVGSLMVDCVGIIFPQLLWITQLWNLFLYFLLFSYITTFESVRHLLEESIYKLGSRKLMYGFLFVVYWIRNMKSNIQDVKTKRERYGLQKNFHDLKKVIFLVVKKTNQKTSQMISTYQLRLYFKYRERTDVENTKWEVWDTNYLIFHIAIFIIFYILGR